MTSTQQQQDQRRITWRVGAAGVLVGAALALTAGAVTIKVVSSAPAEHRVDVIVPESSSTSEAPLAPVIEVTPSTDPAPAPAPAQPAAPAPLDQRVTHLEQRVDNLETTTTTTTIPTTAPPTTTH